MPRRRGGGGFGGRRRAAPKPQPQKRAASTRAAPPPARRAAAPAPAQQSSGGGMMSGLGGMVAQGMAFGTGSAIAHQAVGAVTGAMSGRGDRGAEEAPSSDSSAGAAAATSQQFEGQGVCGAQQEQLYACLQQNAGDASVCQYYFDALKQCNANF